MGFQTMGRRRPLSRFMFGVAFLIWMASTILLSQNPSALLWTVAPYQFAWTLCKPFIGPVAMVTGVYSVIHIIHFMSTCASDWQ